MRHTAVVDYPIQTPHQLAAHLRALRKARGLSQAALGDSLGVGQTRIARIEGNPTAISVEQLIAVLGALGVQLVLREVQARAPVNSLDARVPRSGSKRRTVDGNW